MTASRQTLVIELPQGSNLRSDLARCGEAVREAMRELVRDRPYFIALCRLVSLTPARATYEIWEQRYEIYLRKKRMP